jgi:hypothetical protein
MKWAHAQWIAMAIAAGALPAAAATYKWVDADGNVHYSDQPGPAGVKEQKLQTTIKAAATPSPGPSAAPAATGNEAGGKPGAQPPKGQKTPAEQEMEFRKRRVEAAEADAKRQKEAELSAEKKSNCELARNRVAQLQAGGRITKASPSGEQVYLGDAEIAQELVQARKAADSWCK